MSAGPFPPPPKGVSLDWAALSRWLLAMETWGKNSDRRLLSLEGGDAATGAADGSSLESFVHAGTSGWTTWQIAGSRDAQDSSGVSLTANQLRAMPFVAPRGASRITAIGFEVTVGAAGNARCGVYSNRGDIDLYPDRLLVDSGSLSTAATGVKNTTALSVPVTPGALYWLVHVQDAAIATRCLTGAPGILGRSNDGLGKVYVDLRVAFAFAALPAAFPAGAQPDTNTGTTTTSAPALYFQVAA